MSAKPCRGCGKLVVFAKDPEGKWQILDNTAPTWKQIGNDKDGLPRVMRAEGVLVSHWSTCREAYKKAGDRAWEQPAARDFNEPKESP